MPQKSLAAERLGLLEATHILAQLCFQVRQIAEVPPNDHAGRDADVANVVLGG